MADYIPPELWVIFDSQGPYEVRESERNARDFCDLYNRREGDPLKPYTYRRYVAPGVALGDGGKSNG